jgi:Zn-dependent M28 family amino/carboxypeptidase
MTGTNTDFGQPLTSTPITADVILAIPLDACTNLTNTNLTGNIALIQRGTCYFDQKFKNAQDKGAAAVIIYNADPLQTVGEMVGSGTASTIPGVLVDNTEGLVIKDKLDTNVTVKYNFTEQSSITRWKCRQWYCFA